MITIHICAFTAQIPQSCFMSGFIIQQKNEYLHVNEQYNNLEKCKRTSNETVRALKMHEHQKQSQTWSRQLSPKKAQGDMSHPTRAEMCLCSLAFSTAAHHMAALSFRYLRAFCLEYFINRQLRMANSGPAEKQTAFCYIPRTIFK